MDEKKRADHASKILQATVNAFIKAAKGRLPIIKKQEAGGRIVDGGKDQGSERPVHVVDRPLVGLAD